MSGLENYISQNYTDIIKALWQHITISLIALVITIVIAVPLAIILLNYPKIGGFVLQLSSMIQTIPSLAILGLLIPFVGIGSVPAIIALVLYAIMPIFSNTYLGLKSIDPKLEEAIDAFGLSWYFKIFRIKLPLAMPMILNGIRIAMVMIIGTATLASLIGGGGLGTYILLGIQTNNNNALLVGAILSALLALIFSYGLKFLSKIPLKSLSLGFLVIILLIVGSFGYQMANQEKHQTIIIAGKMGSEPEILINMYKDLIEQDNENVSVELKPNFGGTTFLFNVLKNGKIDIYPEFTGTVLQSLVKNNTPVPKNPAVAYHDSSQKLKSQFEMDYLRPMKYQNGYAMVVSASDAQKYHLKDISDLTKVPQFRAVFDPDFYQQSDGYPGLKKVYQLDFKNVKTMEPSLRYEALSNGQADVTDAYTTDPQIRKDHLVILKDNKKFFPPYQAAPLMKNDFAKQNPKVVTSLEKISGKVTTKQMQEMNYEVSVKHKKAAVVAKQFLEQHHLIRKE